MPSDPCLDIENAVLRMLAASNAVMSADVQYDLFLNTKEMTKPDDSGNWTSARQTPDWSKLFKTKQEYEQWLWQAVTTNFKGREYPWSWVFARSWLRRVVLGKRPKAYLLMIKRENSKRPCAAIFWVDTYTLEFWDTQPITDGIFLPVADCVAYNFRGQFPVPRIANSAPHINVMKPEDPAECRMWCLYWALLRICLGCTPGTINEWYLSKTQQQRWTVIDTFRKLFNGQSDGPMDPKMLLHIPNMAPCKEEFKLGKRLANPDVSVEVPQDKRLKLTYDLWEKRLAKKKLAARGSTEGCALVAKGAQKYLADFANIGTGKHDIYLAFRGEVPHPYYKDRKWVDVPNIKHGISNQDWKGLTQNLPSHDIFKVVDRYFLYHGNVFKTDWTVGKPTFINVTTAGHASGAIYWPGDNVLEIWNTTPIKDTTFVVLAKLIKKVFYLSKYPTVVDGGATFYMQAPRKDVGDAEKADDDDRMCQTWVWYWAFMRIVFGCPPAKFKKWIESTAIAKRADLMQRFFAILASVGKHGGRIKNVDELSKYMDTSMCQTAKPRSANGFYAPSARPMVDDEPLVDDE
jgi:hypothetical protein